MEMRSWHHLLAFLVLCLTFKFGSCVDDYELDLYDLVEEVNGTFYEFMGVQEDCGSSDVRRAYRKLSLQLHPDKNKDEDAEVKFRQLVGIYEVLKSSEKRERYDYVLVNGLPTWRQPMYYYRKVRKFGFAESAVVLAIIASIIHYAMLWAAYWEKCFEIDEVYQSRLKKGKRKNHMDFNDDLEEEMKRRKDDLVRPNLTHLLGCQLVSLIFRTIINLPQTLMWMITVLRDRINPEDEAEEEEITEEHEAKKKVRGDDVFSNMSAPEMAASSKPVIYQENPQPIKSSGDEALKKSGAAAKKVRWTDEDDARLARAMQKFPAGTALRWERIAQQLNHLPAEILARAKQLKAKNFNHTTEGVTVLPDIKKTRGPGYTAQGGISTREEPSQIASEPQQQPTEWSQPQQKALEAALASVPKTAADRWGEIAALVPGKNKVDCMTRFKYLAAAIRQKKANANPT